MKRTATLEVVSPFPAGRRAVRFRTSSDGGSKSSPCQFRGILTDRLRRLRLPDLIGSVIDGHYGLSADAYLCLALILLREPEAVNSRICLVNQCLRYPE